MQFEWDSDKAASNVIKHGVGFPEALTVFGDPFEITIGDSVHSLSELRFLNVGMSGRGRLLVVAYTERDGRIRIVSAGPATSKERRHYESAGRS